MSRIRTIKPAFFRSLTLAELPRSTRLTFIGLWTYVDDEGRGVDNAKLVKADLWPLDDDYTVKMVEKDLAALAESGLINRYSVQGKGFFHITSWTEHQVINHKQPSAIPDLKDAGDHSGIIPVTIPEPSVLEGKGKEGKGILNPCDPAGHADVPKLIPDDDHFDDFWDRYPKRNGKKLGRAKSALLWSKLTKANRALALAAVGHYADACDSDMTLPKDPERFIKGEHWIDWQEPAKAAAPARAVGGVLAGSVKFEDSYYGRSQR